MTESGTPKEGNEILPPGEDQQDQTAVPVRQDDGEVEQLRAKLEQAEQSAKSFKDQFLRKAAEFENFKRRSEADYLNLIKNANEVLMSALLPILNDFARSLKHGREQKDYDSFYRGIELISAKMTKILEAQGLIAFDSVGKPFDVGYHDALLQIPRDDVPPHTVIEEVEPGYKLHDKVLRHAKVIVSSAPHIAEIDTGNGVNPVSVQKNDQGKDAEK
jgi:molecular chaperone GrpE